MSEDYTSSPSGLCICRLPPVSGGPDHCKAARLSQEEFAARCGLDRTYMSSIERGKRNVALRNIEAIAMAFDISLSELLRSV